MTARAEFWAYWRIAARAMKAMHRLNAQYEAADLAVQEAEAETMALAMADLLQSVNQALAAMAVLAAANPDLAALWKYAQEAQRRGPYPDPETTKH